MTVFGTAHWADESSDMVFGDDPREEEDPVVCCGCWARGQLIWEALKLTG